MDKNIVVVIGAGASKEFGLPVGTELAKNIVQKLDIRFDDGYSQSSGDRQIAAVVRQEAGADFNNYLYAAWRIRDGLDLADSIDNFMDKHQQDKRLRYMGELGIVKEIGEAERKSTLWSDPRYDRSGRGALPFEELENTWLKKLFRRLQRKVRKEALETLFEKVTFIIFNYDRCVEHFLLFAIQQSYGVDERQAAQVIATANIIHPYGVIGYLPWQVSTPGVRVEFGAERLPIMEMTKGIRTYADRIEETDTLGRVHKAIADADLICFLGFSYLEQNLELLTPPGIVRTRNVLGTTLGISEFNGKAIADELRIRFETPSDGDVVLAPTTCAEFVADFERAFS